MEGQTLGILECISIGMVERREDGDIPGIPICMEDGTGKIPGEVISG